MGMEGFLPESVLSISWDGMFSSSSQGLPPGLSFPLCPSAVGKGASRLPPQSPKIFVCFEIFQQNALSPAIGWEAGAAAVEHGARAPSTVQRTLSSDAAEPGFHIWEKQPAVGNGQPGPGQLDPRPLSNPPLLICGGRG